MRYAGRGGSQITAKHGELVQVTLRNESVPEGITLHWHGLDVPNGEDGVAGVTQDAVRPGEAHVYRFVAEQVGTYWYHSHQLSHELVRNGLWGVLVIEPSAADVVAAVHTYDKVRTVNGGYGERRVAAPGPTVRVRVINTDNGPMPAWVDGASYRVVAVDGTDVNAPPEVNGKAVLVTAGGRIDLQVAVPRGTPAQPPTSATAATQPTNPSNSYLP